MLRVSPALPSGAEEREVIKMNAAAAQELPGVDELDELYRLDASETEPEDDDEDEDEDEDDQDEEGIKPEEMPHP